MRKPSPKTIIRFSGWVHRNFKDVNLKEREVYVDNVNLIISDPDATTGLLLSLRRDKKITRVAAKAIERGALTLNEDTFKWSSEFLTVNGFTYQTKLVSGMLDTLDTHFEEFPVYQGDKDNPLLFLTNSLGEIGAVAPLIPPPYESKQNTAQEE